MRMHQNSMPGITRRELIEEMLRPAEFMRQFTYLLKQTQEEERKQIQSKENGISNN